MSHIHEQQEQEQEQDADYATIIAIAADISVILETNPDRDVFHPMWVSQNGPLIVTICHHAHEIGINIDNISRAQFLALVGVAAIYDYDYDEFSFEIDEEFDEEKEHKDTPNPFQLDEGTIQ